MTDMPVPRRKPIVPLPKRRNLLADGQNPEDIEISKSQLRWLVDMRDQVMKLRINAENRARTIEQGRDEGSLDFFQNLGAMFSDMEDDIIRVAEDQIKTHPAWDWLSKINGVGPLTAAKLLAILGNVEDRENASQLWRYCGLAVVEVQCKECEGTGEVDGKPCENCQGRGIHGRREYFQKGQKTQPYNARAKTQMYLLGNNLLRSGSKFAVIYDRARARYGQTRPYWTLSHQHRAALRVREKVFLSCLWKVCRRNAGLPIRPPYVIEYLGHTTEFDPSQFVEWEPDQFIGRIESRMSWSRRDKGNEVVE